MRILLVLAVASGALAAQTSTSILANDKIELTVLTQGTGMASMVLKDDPARLNPLWNPGTPGPGIGHFLCVDGFGGVSPEEHAAGFPSHGEAHLQQFEIRERSAERLTLGARLPLAQENVTRTFRLLAGEQVISVETHIENLLSFDRPIQWAEHATVGSPFLEPGVTVIDMPAAKAKTRPYEANATSGGLPHRLPSGQEFTWPMAPGADGTPVDMRLTPVVTNSGDHTASLLDPARELVWVTALNPKMHLIVGYLFRRSEFPWVQTWLNFQPNGKLARGMEFSTQPYDVPRRQVVTGNSLFGTPLYRWLPAKSAISSKFLMFYAHVPEGWSGVRDVRLEGGSIAVEERGGKGVMKLRTAQQL
jgi:hypothetical protein